MESNIDDDDTREKSMYLFSAIAKGKTDKVKSLLEDGVKTDIIDKNNKENTPLHSAVEKDKREIVVELLNPKWKTDTNLKNAQGNTPLDIAKQRDYREIIQLLQSHHEEKGCSLETGHLETNDQKTSLIYKRTAGAGGIGGQLCEINLSMLILLKGTIDERIKSFHLASNMEEADKFDDVVFKYDDVNGKSKIVFLQSKHKTSRKSVTLNDVLTNSETGDFSLNKYFISYRKIKRNFEDEKNINHPIFGGNFENSEFIIYTNSSFDYGVSKCIKLSVNEIYLLPERTGKYFQFEYHSDEKEKILSVLENSSDGRRLAKALAEAFFSKKGIDVKKDIFQRYHQALQKKVMEKTSGSKGKLCDEFLKNYSKLRTLFLDEVKKIQNYPANKKEQKLEDKEIELSYKFWVENCNRYLDLPDDDEIHESEVRDFLNKFKLYAVQANEKELEKLIKEMLQDFYKVNQQDIDSVFADVENKVRNWWKEKTYYLTENNKFVKDALRVSILFDVMEPVTSFSGREQELVNLHKILQEGCDAVISQSALISGLGGIGKSETARKYLSVYRNYYDNNLIWINAENHSTTLKSFKRLAEEKLKITTLKIDGTEKEIRTLMDDVFNFFIRMHRKCIFVFDNAEKHVTGGEGVDELLPVGLNKPYVLITSREQNWGEIQNLLLDVLTDDAAGEFIRKALKGLIDVEENDTRRLANALGNFPLALRQAVAYITLENQTAKKWSGKKLTISSYLKLFQENAPKVLSDATKMHQNRYTQTVMTTWKTTLQKITMMNNPVSKLALRILNVIAYLAPIDIPVELIFAKKEGKDKVVQAVELLGQYSMVSLDDGKVSIHRLVQHVTRIELEDQGLNDGIFEDIFELLDACFPTYSHELQDIYKKRAMLPHFEAFLSHIEDLLTKQPDRREEIENGYLVNYFEAMADGYQHYPERKKKMLLRVLEIQEKHFGPDHYEVASTLHDLGNAYGSLGDAQKQKQFLEHALEIQEKHLGPDHYEVATTLINLGNAYASLGDVQKQKQLLERALEIKLKHLGPDHYEVARTLHNLGIAYGSLGDAQKQKQLLEHALEIQEKHFKPDQYEVARTLHNLGNAYGSLGDAQKQKNLYEHALEIKEKHFGPNHYKVAITLINLGIAYGSLGDAQKQKQLLENALEIQEKHLGPDHYEVARTLMNLGNAYGSLGDAQKQKQLLEHALEIKEKHFGPDHYEVARTLHNLGNAYGSLGDAQKQKQLLEHALEIKEKHLGPDHYEVARTLHNLGNAYGSLGDAQKQKQLLEHALEIKEKHFGPDHYEVARTLRNLGNAYGSLGDAQKQKQLLEHALEIQEKHFGPDHCEVTRTLHNLGNAYESLGNAQKKKLLEHALEIQEKNLGPDH